MKLFHSADGSVVKQFSYPNTPYLMSQLNHYEAFKAHYEALPPVAQQHALEFMTYLADLYARLPGQPDDNGPYTPAEAETAPEWEQTPEGQAFLQHRLEQAQANPDDFYPADDLINELSHDHGYAL